MQSEAQTLECDLLVIGGGMAGMSAAARAAESGARVVVVEKAPEVGGSALMSGGYFWTLPSFRQLRANDDGELQDIVSSGYAAAINWLKSRDVPMSAPMEVVNGRGQQVDMITHMKSCQSSVQSAGGYIVAGTQVRRLLKEGTRVVGAETSHPDGDVTVQAKWTLLATGGYQGSPELRAKYMRPEAVNFQLRSNPYSVGDGLRLAEEAGST